MQLFRPMRSDPRNPAQPVLVMDSSTSRGLGARRDDQREDDSWDVRVVNGMVRSHVSEGISVSINGLAGLPPSRLPRRNGGNGPDDPIWMLDLERTPLPKALILTRAVENPAKGYVEPAIAMPIQVYEQAIWTTQVDWVRI